MKQTKEAKPKKTKTYSVSLKVADQVSSFEADTLVECLANLKPDFTETEGLLSATKGKLKSAEIYLRPFQVRQLVANDDMKIIMADRLETSLE